MISIQLTKTEPSAAPEQPHVWPLRVVAVATGRDSAIFVYRAGEADVGDVFECVASVAQMDELPKAGAAKLEENLQIPFFRKNELIFNCRSIVERAQLWKKIQAHVQLLVDNLNASENLISTPDIVHIESTQAGEPAVTSNAFTLSALPVGDVDVDSGDQTIVYPPTAPELDTFYEATAELFGSGVPQVSNSFGYSTSGWLPIAMLPADKITQAAPAGAKFWINLAFYPKLRARLASARPYDRHFLVLNGATLPYGVVYKITDDAIYWLDFPPASVPGFPTAGNAPWPLNYSDLENIGTPMLLQLTLQP
jgi:hypothetical protein